MCACVCVLKCMYGCAHSSVDTLKSNLGYLSLSLPTLLFFLRPGLSLNLDLIVGGRLAGQGAPRHEYCCTPSTLVTGHSTMPSFHGGARIQIQILMACLATGPAPTRLNFLGL